MHIALDARAVSHPQKGGFKTYSAGLVHALAAEGPEHRFTWYTDRRLQTNQIPNNVTVRIVRQSSSIVGMPMREQLQLPLQLHYDRPDLVHFLTNTAPLWSPTPMVVTIHDTLQLHGRTLRGFHSLVDRQALIKLYSGVFLRRAARHARLVITDSEASKRDLVNEVGISAQRVRVIYPGIRPIFHPNHPVKDSLPSMFVLAMASADGRKDPATVMSAYSRLSPSVRERTGLVIVTSSDLVLKELSIEAGALGISAKFMSGVSDTTLAQLYRTASVFVFPSLGEGFGLPVVEAMASGTAVIASNTTSIPEIAGDGAILVTPRDSLAIARALEDLLTNHQLRRTLAFNGLRRAAEFSWPLCARRTLQAYDEINS